MRLEIQTEKLVKPEYREGVLDALREISNANNTVLNNINNNPTLAPNQKTIGGNIVQACTKYAINQIDLINQLVNDMHWH